MTDLFPMCKFIRELNSPYKVSEGFPSLCVVACSRARTLCLCQNLMFWLADREVGKS